MTGKQPTHTNREIAIEVDRRRLPRLARRPAMASAADDRAFAERDSRRHARDVLERLRGNRTQPQGHRLLCRVRAAVRRPGSPGTRAIQHLDTNVRRVGSTECRHVGGAGGQVASSFFARCGAAPGKPHRCRISHRRRLPDRRHAACGLTARSLGPPYGRPGTIGIGPGLHRHFPPPPQAGQSHASGPLAPAGQLDGSRAAR
jgi:hypothetical protein